MLLDAVSSGRDRAELQEPMTLFLLLGAQTPWGQVLGDRVGQGGAGGLPVCLRCSAQGRVAQGGQSKQNCGSE